MLKAFYFAAELFCTGHEIAQP